MNLLYLIYTYMHITLILETNSLNIFQTSLKREVRYTKFNTVIKNSSYVTIGASFIKQYYDKQIIYIHIVVHKPIIELHATFSVAKCKDHYVDCYNVVTYDICNACSKFKLLSYYVSVVSSSNEDQNCYTCPLHGEYIKNVTIDGDTFGASFGLSTDKYWEYYWRTKFIVLNENKLELFTTYLDFYFIQFRSRKN